MPELPEVETTLRGVWPHLRNRRISEVIVREKRLRWPIPDTVHDLEGHFVETGRRRGKYLLFGSDHGTLMIHLGMSGSLRLTEAAAEFRKHDHFALGLDSGKQLRLHDPRRFGTVQWITSPPEDHPLLRDLGPEPLSDAFTASDLHTRLRGKQACIKQAIMDSHLVVGVGNIYACESLFMAGIRPTKPAGKISKPRLTSLVDAIRDVLEASIEMGGTTLRDFLHEDGQPGYFKQTLRVYDREGQPCRRCDSTIRRILISQRSTFYCPKCQR